MSRRFACPRGHIWYADLPAPAGDTTRILPSCPSCGEVGELYPARLSDRHQTSSTSMLESDALVIVDEAFATSAEQGRPPDLPGYEIRGEVGRGGMGVVYEAIDLKYQGRVAIKHLPRIDPGKILRFKREFRALADLSHPNLAAVHELLQIGNQWFIVMEWVDGDPFVDHFLTVPDLAERTRLIKPALAQLVEGVCYLHQNGLLHCDIKPSNVLIAKNGRVVLLDFGLVTEWNVGGESPSAELVGSLGYLAPERFAGKPASAASDWYAVGVMIYEVLVGKRPFAGSRTRLIWQQRYMDPPAPIELNPEVPTEWSELCSALVHRDPTRRPSGAELLARLRTTATTAATPVRIKDVPLIGRDSEMAILTGAFKEVENGHSAMVQIRAPSGMGKTVLVERFLDRLARRNDVTVLRGRCFQQESVPFKGVDGLIDGLSQHLVSLPDVDLRNSIPAEMGALCRVFPVMRRIKIAATTWHTADGVDPLEVRRRSFSALREILTKLSAMRPVVLYLDDLQWADIDSARLLLEVFRPPTIGPILLMLCWQPTSIDPASFLSGWQTAEQELSHMVQIDLCLDPLTELESSSLAATLLADSEADDALVTRVAQEAQGWPVYVHELARHYRQFSSLPVSQWNMRLNEAITARVRQLPEPAQRVLEVLAVASQPLPLTEAAEAAELTDDVRAVWTALRSAHLIRELRLGDALCVECSHDSTREAILSRLNHEQRAALHDRLVQTFAAHNTKDPVLLAVHHLGAGRTEEAGRQYELAARDAEQTLAFDRAAQLYRLSLDLLPRSPEESARVWERLADCAANAGHGRDAAEAYLAAGRGTDRTRLQHFRRLAAFHYSVSGHFDHGVQLLRELLIASGIRFPSSRWKWAARWTRLRRRPDLRRLRLREIGDCSLDELERVDLCWTAAAAYGLYEWHPATYFQSVHLAEALAAGERLRLLRAVVWQAAQQALESPFASGAETPLTVARGLASDEPYEQALVAFAEGVLAFARDQGPQASERLAHADHTLRVHCSGSAWERDAAGLFLCLTLSRENQREELRLCAERMRKDARDRGDRLALTNLAVFATPLSVGDSESVEPALESIREALADWKGPYSLQRFLGAMATARLLSRAGRREAAAKHLSENKSAFEKSGWARANPIQALWQATETATS